MPDIISIAAAIGGLKTAADITKGFLDLKETAAVQGKVIELQGVILNAQSSALAAQSDQLGLLEEVRGLKAKMAELEAWDAQKKRYALTDYGGGTFAYALKPASANGEPLHRICPACYEKGRRSVLQNHGRNAYHQEMASCPACETKFNFEHRQETRQNARARTDFDPFGA
jgi:hypothetical protein